MMKTLERLRYKLQSINYPTAATFDVDDRKQRMNLIVWLEDRVIRFMSPEQRIRDIFSPDWDSYLRNYLESLKCPFDDSDPYSLVDWLCCKALLLDYETTAPKSNSLKKTASVTENIFESIDTEGDEFRNNVNKLATLLQVPCHSDPKITFEGICLLIQNKLSSDVIADAIENYGQSKIEMLKLDQVCLGFDVSDPIVHAAAVALRLLNVNAMRELQDKANAAIVHVQKLTADPKTDEKLGKVGF